MASRKQKQRAIKFSAEDLAYWTRSSVALATAKRDYARAEEQIASATEQRDAQSFVIDALADARSKFLATRGIGPEQRFWINDDGLVQLMTAEEYAERFKAAVESASAAQ